MRCFEAYAESELMDNAPFKMTLEEYLPFPSGPSLQPDLKESLFHLWKMLTYESTSKL